MHHESNHDATCTMNQITMQPAKGGRPTKTCRDFRVITHREQAVNKLLDTRKRYSLTQLTGIQLASEERAPAFVDGVEVVGVRRAIDEFPFPAEFQAALNRCSGRRVSMFTPVAPVGEVVNNGGRSERQTCLFKHSENWADSRYSWTTGLRHHGFIRPLCTSYASLCLEYDNCNSHLIELSISYLYTACYACGNDSRGAPGRDKGMKESAPVKERSTVVRIQAMKPNDRTRTNAPGMDNCIGPKATADHEVAA